MKGDKFIVIWDTYVKTFTMLILLTTLGIGFSLGMIVRGMITDSTDSHTMTPPVVNEPLSEDTSHVCETEITEETTQITEETNQITEETNEIFELIDTPTYYNCPLDNELQDYIRELCEERGIPMSLVIALIEIESSFRTNVVSGTSDYGLMQINACNHEWLSRQYGITDFLDPYQNVFCGITILAMHYDQYQNENMALMAYNLGDIGAKNLWDKGVYETKYTRLIQSAKVRYENEIE